MYLSITPKYMIVSEILIVIRKCCPFFHCISITQLNLRFVRWHFLRYLLFRAFSILENWLDHSNTAITTCIITRKSGNLSALVFFRLFLYASVLLSSKIYCIQNKAFGIHVLLFSFVSSTDCLCFSTGKRISCFQHKTITKENKTFVIFQLNTPIR